jgi:hypothetical protein
VDTVGFLRDDRVLPGHPPGRRPGSGRHGADARPGGAPVKAQWRPGGAAGDGGLGAALFDALDLNGGYAGQASDAGAQGAALVLHSLAESQGSRWPPAWVLDLAWRANPARVVTSYHICLS